MPLPETLRKYIDLRIDKASEADTVARIKGDAAFRGANLWVLVFAIFVASLGLNVNSTAVIIGAMLISPLMGPIVGMGFAVGTADVELLRSSAKNFGVATVASVLTATLYFLLSPYKEAQSELLARTAPTLYDVLIAFFGGCAGIVGIATGGRGNVIPGVAIATALMPPLCTAGYGIATGQWLFFLGAFYLFFINTVFIASATFLGVRLMGFSQVAEPSPSRAHRTRNIMMSIILLTLVPAGVMTLTLVRQSLFRQDVAHFVDAELAWPGTQVLTQDVDGHTLKVAVIGREVEASQIEMAERRMGDYGLGDYQLSVIQGTQSDSLLALVGQLETTDRINRQTSAQQNWQIADLKQKLEAYERYERVASELRPELKVLFPHVETLTLAKAVAQNIDTTVATPVVIAVVATGEHRLAESEQRLLQQWLATRTSADSLHLVVTH